MVKQYRALNTKIQAFKQSAAFQNIYKQTEFPQKSEKMTRPMHRSRTLRRVKRKTPGGKVSMQYKERKPQPAKCANCGAVLKGVARERPYKMKRLPKSAKRPERPFGGNLCSKCSREKIKAEIRATA